MLQQAPPGDVRPRGALPARRRAARPARPDGPAVPDGRATRRRSSCCRSRPAAPASTSSARATSSTSIAGGTRPSRIRPPTAPSASARRAGCRCTSSSARARWRRRIDEMIAKKRGLAERVVGAGRGMAHGAQPRRAALRDGPAAGGGGGMSDDFRRRLPALGPAPQGQGRHPRALQAGSLRAELVGAPLARGPGIAAARRPPRPRARLRAAGPGDRPLDRGGPRARAGAGLAARSRTPSPSA